MSDTAKAKDKFTLPDGTVLSLNEMVHDTLRSAFAVDPWGKNSTWDLFTAARSQTISGADFAMTRVHTNMPIAGCLPKDWHMLAYNWKAVCTDLNQPVIDWAGETLVTLFINDKRYGERLLAELLLDRPSLGGDLWPSKPVHIPERTSFNVRVETTSDKAVDALRAYLRGDKDHSPIDDQLRMLERLGANTKDAITSTIVDNIRTVRRDMQPGRMLTCFVSIDGVITKPVI